MMTHTKTRVFLAALSVLSFAANSHAATLAFYDIESNLTQADEAGATGLTTTAIDATSADGTSSNFAWEGSRVPYWFFPNIDVTADPGVADILATFSLTPDSGQQIELGTTGVFDIGVLAYQTGTGYQATVRLIVASDSGFTNILATSTTLSDDASNGGSTHTEGFLDLDNPVISSSTLYFGVAMVVNQDGNNSRFDAVGVNGTIAPVPEPSTFGMLCAALLLLAGRRRRA